MKTKQQYIILAIILIACIIFSMLYNPIRENIIPQRLADVVTILSNDSLDANQQIKMLKIIEIGDPYYRDIIHSSNMGSEDKVKQLKNKLKIENKN